MQIIGSILDQLFPRVNFIQSRCQFFNLLNNILLLQKLSELIKKYILHWLLPYRWAGEVVYCQWKCCKSFCRGRYWKFILFYFVESEDLNCFPVSILQWFTTTIIITIIIYLVKCIYKYNMKFWIRCMYILFIIL